MCGIAGVIDFRGRDLPRDNLERCNALLRHRGPDDCGIWVNSRDRLTVGLAATRLAVIDLRSVGRQPLTDNSGRYVIAYNGEIYNHRELHKELVSCGCRFRTNTDTEVIVNGYARWGIEVFNRLNGMWSLCIYDKQEQTGLLCRDRFGIKPLLYCLFEDRLSFASEMQVFAALPTAERRIDSRSLLHYLRYGYVVHPRTIYAGFKRLSPGHLLRFSAGGASEPKRYYQLRLDEAHRQMEYADACREVRRRIAEAVRARTIADVPLGALLSGGLDSSIVVSHLAEATTGPLKTFSIGYEDHKRYDETRYANIVAKRFATQHHAFKVTLREVLDHLPKMLDHLGEPFADASLIPTSIISALMRREVTVALSGDGADELFGGYTRYLGHHYLERYRNLPKFARRRLLEPLLARMSASKSSTFGNWVRQARKLLRADDQDPLRRHDMWSRILSPEAEARLLANPPGTDGDVSLPEQQREQKEDGPSPLASDWLNRILGTDFGYQLPADMLHKVDLASMRHSLEVRVPMLDPAVVEFASALPSDYKIAGRTRKRILIDAYRDMLPSEILSRPKMGFELPIGEFLRNELKDMFLSTVTRGTVQNFPFIDYDGITELYEQHCSRRAEHADVLYALLVLCWWKK